MFIPLNLLSNRRIYQGSYQRYRLYNDLCLPCALEAVNPDTEAVTPDAEAVTPDTEAVTPDTEAVTPDVEAVTPDIVVSTNVID
ncbi:hypothetical protein BgiMline_032566 [Biomphalaria glabrata]|nr:hypothetical protein BgiMline_015578 [Biomphalaria glabrata]